MDSDRAGTFVRRGSYRVFIPKPLPPDPPLVYDTELIRLSCDAHRALGKLDGLARIIPNPEHFITMYVRKEALLSSQIEGTQASMVDLVISEVKGSGAIRPDIREVMNYIRSLEYGLKRVRELPFSLRLLREIHEILLEGVRGSNRSRGQFRTIQNWVGPPGCRIEDADFIPPPVPEMNQALDNFERYYHEGIEEPLIKCGLLHAQLETIHPFLDGNGRMGRLLITFFLREQNILERPLLYLSYYFKKYRLGYYDALMAIRTRGDWEGWLKFFLRGVIEVAEQAMSTAQRIIQLETADARKIIELTKSNNAILVHKFLLRQPVISIPAVQRELNVTYLTARNLVQRFEECGMLKEITGQRRDRLWVYDEYMKILAEGTSPANYEHQG